MWKREGKSKIKSCIPIRTKEKTKKRFKTRLLAYTRIIMICLTYFIAVKSQFLNCILWDISRGTILHINVFLAYLLVQEPFFNKNYFLEFLTVGCNLALKKLNVFAANGSTNLIQIFHVCTWTTRNRKRPALRAICIAKFAQHNQPYWNFLLHNFTCIPQIFVPNLPKRSKPSASKQRHLWTLEKVDPY